MIDLNFTIMITLERLWALKFNPIQLRIKIFMFHIELTNT